MTTAFTSAIASRGIGLMLYLELSHPAELSETVPFAVKDRASRLKRGFPGTRHHEWLEALSKSMGFPGWNALAEASARLMDLVHPDGTFDPDPPIPAEFAETLVLVVEPNPESRPSDSFILELQAFAQKLASHSGQSPEALLDNMASWWGARNWSAFTTRDPALAQKPFYEFEVTDEFDMRGEPYSTGEWRLSSACQQAVRQLQAAAVALNGAGEDLVPFLRRAFDGHNGEQPVLQAGLALGNVLLERGQNEDALQVLKELDQRASTTDT
jgi:hypothetical protein